MIGGGATGTVPTGGMVNYYVTEAVVNDLSQGQTIENVTLAVKYTLSVSDVSQGQTIENAALTQHNVLVVAGLSQGETVEATALSGAASLAIAGLAQSQTIGTVTLTQHYVLVVQGVSQAQTLALVQFGGDVVAAELTGTVAAYRLLDGDVSMQNMVTGTITVH